jgi:PPK2 family polyphosphate:nucleotide phosphotransferase
MASVLAMSSKPAGLRDVLRFPTDGRLEDFPTDARRRAPGGKKATRKAAQKTGLILRSLQDKLFAQASAGGTRRVLLVLQGMDTGGKGGVVDHVVGMFGPEGTAVKAFKQPTERELNHRFLWRIRRALPDAGQVGVFDRSHYEDVLIVAVHGSIDDAERVRRYEEINRFEAKLVAEGTTIVKCFLHISFDTQRERLLARLANPDKHWKFNEADIDERQFWPAYQQAYLEALRATSTDVAPWFVIPSDRKWYRNWAVGELLRETMSAMDLAYPQVDLDLDRLRARLAPPD